MASPAYGIMTPRAALRFILITATAFVILLAVAAVLNSRLQRQQPTAQVDPTGDVLLDNMLLKLDASGRGAQVISGTQVNVSLSPYPVRAGEVITILVVGIKPGEQVVPITPTLFVSPAQGGNANDVLQVDLSAYTNGAYRASQPFVPQNGVWRLRVHFYLNETDTSDVIVDVAAGVGDGR